MYKRQYLTKHEADSTRPFSGRVYQLRRDAQGNRLAFVKVLSGILQVKDEVLCPGEGEPELRKVNELRLYSGAKFAPEDVYKRQNEEVCLGDNMVSRKKR